MSPDSPPLAPAAGAPSGPPGGRGHRALVAVAGVVAVAILAGLAVAWSGGGPEPSRSPSAGAPTGSATPTSPGASASTDAAEARAAAVRELLAARAAALLAGDRNAWLAYVDPTQPDFLAEQERIVERLADVPFSEWAYQLVGDGPPLPVDRKAALPEGSAIVRVRLTYTIEGTETRTNREQYLTVVPRGGRWLLAGDLDAEEQGLSTQRDLWDFGPVRLVRGERSTVLADRRSTSEQEVRRLAEEVDAAVEHVDEVWPLDWSRRPVVLLPRTQRDMATLIGGAGKGLAQIAAVTTGDHENGVSRGDRVVINPGAFGTLGADGRSVVLTHEMTHVATRASNVVSPPIWLSEGFADYVAYRATPVATAIVAGDIIDQVRAGSVPRRFPEQADFDAGEGDIAAAYESAWLACRMIARTYGERDLVRFYRAMTDSAGPGWPEEAEPALGVSAKALTRQWRGYLRQVAR